MIKFSAKPCACLHSSLAHDLTHHLLFHLFSFFHHLDNKKCSYSSDHSCLSSGTILFVALVIMYVSAVQNHFWRTWKLVFNLSFVAPCTCIRANIFVTENLLVCMRLKAQINYYWHSHWLALVFT